MLRRLAPVAFTLLLTSIASTAGAQGVTEFEACRNAYKSGDFTEAESRCQALADALERSGKPSDFQLDVWMFAGASKLLRALRMDSQDPVKAEDRQRLKEEAGKLFEKVILQKPTYEPDALTFKVSVLDAYSATKSRLQDVLTQRAIEEAKEKARKEQLERDLKAQQDAYIALLEAQAADRVVVEHHSRWIALLPFGVGQYQNGNPVLGTIFLGLEAACLIGTGVTFGIFRWDIAQGANELATYEGSRRAAIQRYTFYTDQAEIARYVNLSLVGATAALMIAGAIEAELNFVRERTELKPRQLPTKPPLPKHGLWVLPTVIPALENGGMGAELGVVGRF